MAFNDIYKLIIHQRIFGGECINKLHFVTNDPAPGNLSQTLADDFRINMLATLQPRAAPNFFFEFVEVQRIVPFGDGPVTSSWPANTAGTYPTGNCECSFVAEVLSIYTAGAGRRKRGRIYLGGVGNTALTAGSISASQQLRTNNLRDALTARYITPLGGQFSLGVWSRKTAGPTPPWSTDAFTRASALVTRTVQRTQRRRQLGVGR